MERKRRFSFKSRLLLMVLIPLLIMALLLTVLGVYYSSRLGMEGIRSELRTFEASTKERYQALNDDPFTMEDGKLMKGDVQVSENDTVIDRLKKETNIDTTIFYGDTRISTTILDESGNRLLGTTADATITDSVLNQGNTVFKNNLIINGVEYVGIYAPLEQPDTGEIIGMIFAGTPKTEMQSLLDQAVITELIVGVLGMFITIIVVVLLSNSMAKALAHSSKEIDKIARGILNYNQKEKYESRGDEIGDVANAAKNVASTLTGIIGNIVETSENLNTFSGQFQNSFADINENLSNIDTAVNEIAKGATSQAMETQNANNGVVDIGNVIDDTISNVTILGESTQKMRDYNQSSMEP